MSQIGNNKDIPQLSIGQSATLACLLDVCSIKPGNVHRGADFEDVTFTDFAVSAVAIAPAMESAVASGVGPTVLSAIQATRAVCESNTNLGIVLLLAPLAAVDRGTALTDGINGVLASLSRADAADVYKAIRLAAPGGLGRAEKFDVQDAPPDSLVEAMRQSADRDVVARQYANGFHEVLNVAFSWLLEEYTGENSLTGAIAHVFVRLLAANPDTLIARKCGDGVAAEASARAAAALAAGDRGSEARHRSLADLDFWLRSDGNRRNPGATADLITAAIFAGLREGCFHPPLR